MVEHHGHAELRLRNAVAQAEGLSQQLREAMTAAFKDGKLTSEEIDNIQSIIDQQNELLAIQTKRGTRPNAKAAAAGADAGTERLSSFRAWRRLSGTRSWRRLRTTTGRLTTKPSWADR
ncbi:MAG: hypothetical protein ACLUI3_00220 [Christensenellales bacterium]